MVVYALLIINKAGGLIYNRTFHSGLQQLSGNDYLILAGSFHSVHAISKTISPVANPSRASFNSPPSTDASNGPNRDSTGSSSTATPPNTIENTGIESMQTSRFLLSCYQTPTGTKFLLFTEPAQQNTDAILRKCYELYADYVMKNPFYSLEMPIRSDKFERAVVGWVGAR